MFKPERLLGALVSEAIGASLGNSLGRGTRNFFNSRQGSAVGMGLIGLAVGAFEHFSAQTAGNNQASTNPPPPPLQSSPPPPPPGSTIGVSEVPSPPAAPQHLLQSAPVAPPGSLASSPSPEESVCLIKAMIAAAACDGVIDEMERQKIISKLHSAGMSAEEQSFLEQALAHPLSLTEILSLARSLNRFQAIAEDIYVASLIAVRVDTEEERQYLAGLGSGLDLSPVRQAQLQQLFNGTSV